jgi:hypothetical protein
VWWILVLGATLQYVHGIFTTIAYHRHIPQAEPLRDIGFELLPVGGTVVAIFACRHL